MRSLEWALNQYDGVLMKRKNSDTDLDTYRERVMKRLRENTI